MKKLLPLVSLIFLTSSAWAAPAAHGEGIPSIFYFQIINFILFAGIIVFIIKKKKLNESFAAKKQAFLDSMNQATRVREAAEARKRELESRLKTLVATADQSRQKARQDADALKASLIQQGEEMAKKLKTDVKKSVEIEVAKAEIHLREELLDAAISGAREQIKAALAGSDQKQLQQEFVEKIQVVR